VKLRLASILVLALLGGCRHVGDLTADNGGGIYAVRSACPIVGIPAGTGDITLFDPAGSKDASAIDVTATITNLRSTCGDAGSEIVSTATFDVVAVRRSAGPARQVVLPYFDVVARGGTDVVAKHVGAVALNFAAGSLRAQTSAETTARVSRSAATLPDNVRKILTRERKAGDPDAAVDPLSDPGVRDAVAKATFEQLIGFQLSQDQLRYNVTR
jgi:hypothetical protein